MKVLHINTNDRGGAATAIIRIHLGLLNKGIDSKLLLLHKHKNVPESYAFKSSKNIFQKLLQKIKTFFNVSASSIREKYPEIEWFSNPSSPYDITEHPLYKEADFIQLNWVSGFLDEPSFFKKNTKPVVWRMPDLYACGCGYHYEKDFPFKKFKTVLLKNMKLRKKALQNTNITFVPISNWVAEKVSQSPIISNFPKQVIHNGLDFSIWKPKDKQKARKHFGIPEEKKVILIGADITHVTRKGFNIAVNAIKSLNNTSICAVVFGNYKEQLPKGFIKVGRINSEEELTQLYSASDYFLMPSIEEAFGQVTLEALSCGIPVISFPTGGSVDVINNEVNGILAADFTTKSLQNAIKQALSQSFKSEEIIEKIQQRFSIEEKVNSYLKLYQQLLL